MEFQYDVAVIGGGPAGSTASLYLTRKGFRTCLIEKHIFPRETLCGEFLSREVIRIIEDLDLTAEFQSLLPNRISTFRFCPEGTRSFATDLKFTAYGLKRGAFDSMLLDQARRSGTAIYQPMTVERVDKLENGYTLTFAGSEGQTQIRSPFVVCAYGKSNVLNKALRRNFPDRRSGFIGVKLHIQKKYLNNLPDHEVQIYTGYKMYCGTNTVNDNTVTLCFLADKSAINRQPRTQIHELVKSNRHFANIISDEGMEKLSSFPIYGTADIYFGTKPRIVNGMFMIGDTAQVIAPLAGDGIGMAMESAKMLAEVLEEGRNQKLSTDDILYSYDTQWSSAFRKRIIIAKTIQQLLFSRPGKTASSLVLSIFPSLLSYTVEKTRD